MLTKKQLGVLAAGLMLFELSGSAMAQGRKPQRNAPVQFSSWIIYWAHDKSDDALSRHQQELEHVSIFAMHFDPSGNLAPADPWVTDKIQQAKTSSGNGGTSYFLTAVNDVAAPGGKPRLKDPGVIGAMLNSPAAMNKHIDDLLNYSQSLKGVEIDYENLFAKDRDAFSHFIEQLASRLHERGQQLIVVVQPKTYESDKDGAGAMNWPELSKHADMIKVMAYYYHYGTSAPGPTAPPDWVADISNFALTQIPPQKLCIALSMEGYDWPPSGAGKSIGYDAGVRLAQSTNSTIQRDSRSQAPHFTYTMNGKHEVWFEDAVSIHRKVDVLQKIGVQHVALWWLGSGEDAVWNKLAVARK